MVINSASCEIENLKKFKELSLDAKNHKLLLKDKKAVLYAATLLDSEDRTILNLCLDIFENIIANENSHPALMAVFGIYESLVSLSIRIRKKDSKICDRAMAITEILRNVAPPAYNTRSRSKVNRSVKCQTVYLLFVADLQSENRSIFEKSLIKIRGVISFLIDIEVRRCTIRICPKVTVKEVVEKIYRKTSMKCLVIRKNKDEEVDVGFFCDVLEVTPTTSYLEYPEEEFLHKSGAIAPTTLPGKQKTGLLSSVVNFWNESFYW